MPGPLFLPATRIEVELDEACQVVLSSAQEDHATEIWSEWKRRRGEHLFNGPVLHVSEIQAVDDRLRLRVGWTDYRTFLLSREDRELELRSLGVSGLLWSRANRSILFGRRGSAVTLYPGWWELVPSGVVDAAGVQGTQVDFLLNLRTEFGEETGWPVSQIQHIDLLGLAFDAQENTYDIAARMEVEAFRMDALPSGEGLEYSEFAEVPLRDLEAFAGGPGTPLLPVSKQLLQACFQLPMRD